MDLEDTMATTGKIAVNDGDLVRALQGLLAQVLAQPDIQALLVPCELPMKAMVMPTLVSDAQRLTAANPLAPAFPLNSARIVGRLTRAPAGGKVAAMMRPCEIRGFIELVKLHQGRFDDLVIIATDCLGAFDNRTFTTYAGQDIAAATRRFVDSALEGRDAEELATACRVCEHPLPDGADLAIGLMGRQAGDSLNVSAQSETGRDLLDRLGLPEGPPPDDRDSTTRRWIARRTAHRDEVFAATRQQTDSLEKLTAYLASCVNCYNCRVVCPVCYCRECVFVTDVFDHEPSQYLGWAQRKGAVKMPTDTVFYHLTRLAHMSTACVGCGQCSNACPNDIPLAELFRSVAARTQSAFDYVAGLDREAKPPLSEFREQEFDEIVGID
jgi:formate dehydrogenase subunit beta